jgi:hypothetical protein
VCWVFSATGTSDRAGYISSLYSSNPVSLSMVLSDEQALEDVLGYNT